MKYLFAILLLGFSLLGYSQETSHICAGSTINRTVSGVTGGTPPYTYTWTSPSNVTTTGATVTLNAAGTWTWTTTDSSTPNTCSMSGTHIVIYEADPTASLVINANNACINTAQTITATGVPAGYTFSWNFGSGATPATATTASNNVTYSTAGSKTITLTITKTNTGTCNSTTCTWVKTKVITVGSLSGGSSCS